jgi:outer membrane protein assembly factor BamB
LNSDNGEIAWHIEKNRSIFSPVVSAQIFAGSLHGELYAIDPVDGNINWRRQFSGWIYSPAVDERSGILWSGGQEHKAYSLSTSDGKLLREYPTTQELVFSPVNLGDGQIAFNLFDGSTMIIQSRSGDVIGSLSGNVQPKDIYQYGETIYRSDRGGGLSAFRQDNLALLWKRPLVSGDLDMHPSLPGFLLLSDRDQSLILFDLQRKDEARRLKLSGKWLSPIQIESGKLVYFQKLMQPPWILAVKSNAQH